MKKCKVTNRITGEVFGKFGTPKIAGEELMAYLYEYNEDLTASDDEFLSPFDFLIEEFEEKDVNTEIASYEDALNYLGRAAQRCLVFHKINEKHKKAITAIEKLFTIAEAWNKADDFTPDFSNSNQRKYFAWFEYDKSGAGFVCAVTDWTATSAYAFVGSRLCFKTSERAKQFGEQFIDLWNDFLLFR